MSHELSFDIDVYNFSGTSFIKCFSHVTSRFLTYQVSVSHMSCLAFSHVMSRFLTYHVSVSHMSCLAFSHVTSRLFTCHVSVTLKV